MHLSAGAIIRNSEGKILMHERVSFPPGWACAAGHVEEGETPEEAMVREAKEETGLDIKKYRLLIHEFVEWNECKRGIRGHDWFLYEVEKWEGDVFAEKKEARNISWKSAEEIRTLKLEPVWEYWFKKLEII